MLTYSRYRRRIGDTVNNGVAWKTPSCICQWCIKSEVFCGNCWKLRRVAGEARSLTENALSIWIVIFTVHLQQTEISERKLFIFHLRIDVAPAPLYHTSWRQHMSTPLLDNISTTSLLLPFKDPTFTVHTLNTPQSPLSYAWLPNLGILRTLCPRSTKGLPGTEGHFIVVLCHLFWCVGLLCLGCPYWQTTLPIYPPHQTSIVVNIEFAWNYAGSNSNYYNFMRIMQLWKSPNSANKFQNYSSVGDSWIPVWVVATVGSCGRLPARPAIHCGRNTDFRQVWKKYSYLHD